MATWRVQAFSWEDRVVHSQEFRNEQDAQLDYEKWNALGLRITLHVKFDGMWCIMQSNRGWRLAEVAC